jgi:2-(1,2-epoxy-1,2-dihydrophenyl)acetyl-CoA isomerase
MPADLLGYDTAHGVATVTLNRPEALNALNRDLKVRLRDVLIAAARDDEVRAVVLTGSGRAFCVGQDLVEHGHDLERGGSSGPGTVWATVADHYVPIATALATMPKPVVAAVNGVAAGAGAAFALACDFRILATSAGFNMAFSSIGLAADSGLSWTLPRMVGMAKAKELLLTPRSITAAEAHELGLATQVVDGDAVLTTAVELAVRLAEGPTVAYGAIRRSLAFSAGHGFDESLQFEADMMAMAGATDDHRDAVRSFAAKQPPTFHGR